MIVGMIALLIAAILMIICFLIFFIKERNKNISFNKKVNDIAKKKKDDGWDLTQAEIIIDLDKDKNKIINIRKGEDK